MPLKPPQPTSFCIEFTGMKNSAVFQVSAFKLWLPVYFHVFRRALQSFDKIGVIKFLKFFCLLFFLEILLHKMSKSSFFYQAEILHSREKFKKSTGSQSSSVVAPRMTNISTFEYFAKSVGGTLS